jgi:DNA polymerase-3 subunit alpha
MGSFIIEDYNGSFNLALFSDDYVKFKNYLYEGAPLFIKATVRNRYNSDDQFDIKISDMKLLYEIIKDNSSKITMRIPLAEISPDFIDTLKIKIKKYKGKCKLVIQIFDTEDKKYINLFARNTGIDAAGFAKAFNDHKEISFKLE